MLPHVAGPFRKKFHDHEQPWHICKFDSVRNDILEREPDVLSDTPSNEQVRAHPFLPQGGLRSGALGRDRAGH
jgi:hypothetical protein